MPVLILTNLKCGVSTLISDDQKMKKVFYALMFCLVLALPGLAQQKTLQDTLHDHMCGKWVLRGLIAGKSTVHDITAEWVLNHQFVLIREVSREKNEKGEPEYQANVYIGWSEPTVEYICLWLDICLVCSNWCPISCWSNGGRDDWPTQLAERSHQRKDRRKTGGSA